MTNKATKQADAADQLTNNPGSRALRSAAEILRQLPKTRELHSVRLTALWLLIEAALGLLLIGSDGEEPWKQRADREAGTRRKPGRQRVAALQCEALAQARRVVEDRRPRATLRVFREPAGRRLRCAC